MANILFRVHFEDGEKLDVTAADADTARKIASKRHPSHITKIKRVKG